MALFALSIHYVLGCSTGSKASTCATLSSGCDSVADDASNYAATGALVDWPTGYPVLVCTGTLMAPRVVLTAAHCAMHRFPQPLRFALVSDVADAVESASVPVRHVYVHPRYDLRSSSSVNDIALFELEAQVPTARSEHLPMPVDAVRIVKERPSVELVGYGGRAASGRRWGNKRAMRATITVLGPEEITIGGPGRPQGCDGDSGGPVFAIAPGGDRVLVAVTSRSANDRAPCMDGSIHTRVDSYATWLAETLDAIQKDEPKRQEHAPERDNAVPVRHAVR
jgi:secreted trypsin-like serine protease